jgi:hypothetical protein
MSKIDPEAATTLLYLQDAQEQLDWCVETERYELAARIRDRIRYTTTDDKEWKEQYINQLKQKYTPADLLDGMNNPTPEKIKQLKQKYLYE